MLSLDNVLSRVTPEQPGDDICVYTDTFRQLRGNHDLGTGKIKKTHVTRINMWIKTRVRVDTQPASCRSPTRTHLNLILLQKDDALVHLAWRKHNHYSLISNIVNYFCYCNALQKTLFSARTKIVIQLVFLTWRCNYIPVSGEGEWRKKTPANGV